MVALAKTGVGIEGNGGGSLTANGCAINTSAAISMKGSAAVTAKSVAAGGAITKTGNAKVQSNVVGGTVTASKAEAATDPLKDGTRIADAYTKLGTAAPPAAPRRAASRVASRVAALYPERHQLELQ